MVQFCYCYINIMKYIYILVIPILFITGCVVTKIHTMPVESFSGSYNEIWDSTVKFLEKEEEPITMADREKGVIATDWVNIQKFFSTKRYRYNIKIDKISEKETQVGIASPQQAYSMGDWEDILPQERRAQRIFRMIRGKLTTKKRLEATETETTTVNFEPLRKEGD